MQRYKHLFFDLDNTLWDFDANAKETLQELFVHYKLESCFESFDHYYSIYEPHNEKLWAQYRQGTINKEELNFQRFNYPFQVVGRDNEDEALKMGTDFLAICPTKTRLFPGAVEILEFLKGKYQMHILSNGFREVQMIKLAKSGLREYFSGIYLSETAGTAKPKRGMFEYAVKNCNARKNQSLMIGDNLEADIVGARKFGMDQVYFNPEKNKHQERVTYEIAHLLELKTILN